MIIQHACGVVLKAVLILFVGVGPALASAQPSKPKAASQRSATPAAKQRFQVIPGLEAIAGLSAAPDLSSHLQTNLLAAAGDVTSITVYGIRHRPRDFDVQTNDYAPNDSEAAVPRVVRMMPPDVCPNAAYMTVAGQAANAQDLIGYLGSGSCY